jgi:hypothetical protein
MTIPLSITSGSDVTIPFVFRDSAGAAIAINSITIIEATGVLDGRCTATLVNSAGGLASVFIEGTTPMAIGSYFLRLRGILTNGNSLASERISINVR